MPQAALGSIYGTPPAGPPGVRAALGMLELLAAHGPMDLASSSRRLRIPKSTLHRIVRVMLQDRWLAADAGHLSLGVRAMAIGTRSPNEILVTAFQQVASRLRDEYNETLCLVLRLEEEVVFIAKCETRHEVRLVKEVGSRLPAFAAASGRVMLADLSDEQLREMFAGRQFETPTGRTIGRTDNLLAELAHVRRRGYAENVEDTAPDLYCVAFPVRDATTAIAAVTFCVPSGRAAPRRRPVLRKALSDGAAEISELVRTAVSRQTEGVF